MPTPQQKELGALIRLMVKARAELADQNMHLAAEFLADQMGIPPRTFEGYYTGKGRLNERDVHILLEAGAACPYLNRAWGARLLRLTGLDRLDSFQDLLDRCWPAPGVTPRPPRIASNWPAPSYPSFVMRQTPYAELLAALRARSPLVVIVGIGGIGKSSLLLEAGARCLRAGPTASATPDHPIFDATVWVSDTAQPGKTRLRTVLETIATTLDYPELTRFDRIKLQHEVDQLLRGRRVLIGVDNLETIVDDALLSWLCAVPEPSKAVVTTRVYPAALQNRGPIEIALERMSETEGNACITLYQNPAHALVESERHALRQATGGNPLAIRLLLGRLQLSGQSVAQVLALSRSHQGWDLGHLVETNWAALTAEERTVLIALTFFAPDAADDALAEVAGLAAAIYFPTIARLSALALIESITRPVTAGADGQRRRLHPLVHQYVVQRRDTADPAAVAIPARRMAWALRYAAEHGGFRPNEPDALARIAVEEANLWASLQQLATEGTSALTVQLAHNLEYFYYTRALWGRNAELYQHLVAAANRLGDPEAQVNALALQIQLLSRQGKTEQAQESLSTLVALSRRTALRGESYFRAQHAQALAHYAGGALREAAAAWQAILDHAEARAVAPKLVTGTLHWLALCRQRQGEPTEARALMERSLAMALVQSNPRRAARNAIALAAFALDAGRPDEAARQLADAQAHDSAPDDEQHAHLLATQGRLYAARGDTRAAHGAFTKAMPLFAHMGMDRELAEVQGWMAELEYDAG